MTEEHIRGSRVKRRRRRKGSGREQNVFKLKCENKYLKWNAKSTSDVVNKK